MSYNPKRAKCCVLELAQCHYCSLICLAIWSIQRQAWVLRSLAVRLAVHREYQAVHSQFAWYMGFPYSDKFLLVGKAFAQSAGRQLIRL